MAGSLDGLVDTLIADSGYACTPRQFKARAALERLRTFYENAPTWNLWFAVLAMAVLDLTEYEPGTANSFYAVDAYRFFREPEIWPCAIAGIDSDYVRRILTETLGTRFDSDG